METTVFLSNRSQAVRLPKAVALPEDVKKSTLLLLAVPGSLPRQESPGTAGSMATVSAQIS